MAAQQVVAVADRRQMGSTSAGKPVTAAQTRGNWAIVPNALGWEVMFVCQRCTKLLAAAAGGLDDGITTSKLLLTGTSAGVRKNCPALGSRNSDEASLS
jgi:hypothetical protein